MHPQRWMDKVFEYQCERDNRGTEQENQEDRGAVADIILPELGVAHIAFIDSAHRPWLEKTTPLTHGTAGF